jgi:hypothetical protein
VLSGLATNEIAISAKENAMTVTRVEPSWNMIFKQLKEDEFEFFLNTDLEPTVLIPGDAFQNEWPVNSERFQDQLISVYYEISKGKILKTNDRDFLMAQIRLECHKGGRRLTEPEAEKTDKDVIVQAILALMNEQLEFSGQTAVLVNRLRKIQSEGKVSFSEEIPIFTNIFSRRLNRLIPVFRGYGIEVEMEHKESGSYCTLKRLETFQREPSVQEAKADGSMNQSSGQSSGANHNAGKQMRHSDDTDGEIRVEKEERAFSSETPSTGQTSDGSSTKGPSGAGTPASTSKKGGTK